MSNSVIYTPRGAAREYAAWACNVYKGCTHGCFYCFGPDVMHVEKDAFRKNIQTRGDDFLKRLEKDARRESHEGTAYFQVHLCFVTDSYQPIEDELQITRKTIEILHKWRLQVAVLTKGGTRALRDIDLFGPGDAMAATMTFATEADSLKYEPGAALPQDRFEALKEFHKKGVPTWISCEPVLDVQQTLYLIQMMHEVVDHVKVGKLNHDSKREAEINWRKFGKDAIFQLENLGYKRILSPDEAVLSNATNRTYYVKQALAKFLEA